MGAGKTTIGQALAERLGWRFIDLDALIERVEAASIAEIFSRSGQSVFRRLESSTLRKVLQEASRPLVLSIGGGAFAQAENADALRGSRAFIIFLDAPLDELWQRVSNEGRAVRPLLSD